MRNCLLFIILLSLLPTAYAKRYALIIGNSNYSSAIGKLKNPEQGCITLANDHSKTKGKLDLYSNSLEGSTLSFGDTLFFLNEGLTVEGKPFKDFLDAKNHAEAIEFYMSWLPINVNFLNQ